MSPCIYTAPSILTGVVTLTDIVTLLTSVAMVATRAGADVLGTIVTATAPILTGIRVTVTDSDLT